MDSDVTMDGGSGYIPTSTIHNPTTGTINQESSKQKGVKSKESSTKKAPYVYIP
jgi:hypothetical protein